MICAICGTVCEVEYLAYEVDRDIDGPLMLSIATARITGDGAFARKYVHICRPCKAKVLRDFADRIERGD